MFSGKNTTLTSKENNVNEDQAYKYKWKIIWGRIISVLLLHVFAIIAAINFIINDSSIWITLYFHVFCMLGSMGVLCGSHRLWSHRSFKANLPLRILLMVLQTLALQYSIFDWSKDHRVHHKCSDTDADPYNSSRGFFFSHIGWTMIKKLPEFKAKLKSIDLSDLYADPVVMFQHNYFYRFALLINAIIPICSAMYFFNISFYHAFCANCLRHIMCAHITWTINSFAHLYGMRPYDKSINPRNNFLVTFCGMGEGYHNYHHVFPYDYSASEFGWKSNWNPATAFIDLFYWIGWATDLKKAPKDSIKSRSLRTGDKHLITENKFCSIPMILDFLTGIFGSSLHIIFLMCLRITYIFVF